MNINFGTLIPILVSILTGGLGCVIFVLAWQRKRSEAITKNWQPTPGIILTSDVKEHEAVDPAQKNKSFFTPVVRYQYAIGGKSYTGYRISFNPVEYTQAKAQQSVSRYSTGSSVTLFFDPLHPEEAVLERNTRGFNLLFSSGLILLAIGLSSCCISLLVFWITKAAK